MAAYAEIPDLYAHGLPPAVLIAQPRALEAVDAVYGTFLLPGHGLAADRPLKFTNLGGSLAEPLSAALVYYAQPIDEDLFRVSLTTGGDPVDLGDAGTGLTSVTISLRPVILSALEYRARWIDQHLVAHSVPLVTWTADVTAMNAILAGSDLLVTLGAGNPQYEQSLAALTLRSTNAQKQLDNLANGVPLRGLVVDQTPAVEEAAPVAWGDPSRGWNETCRGAYRL